MESSESAAAVDETMSVDIKPDRMEATVTFIPAQNGGKKLTQRDIVAELTKSGVVYGIKDNVIETISTGERNPFKAYTVAVGDMPINGKDGSLECFFNTEAKSYAPKQLKDGSVDYKNLDLIETVEKGKLLAKITPAEQGTPGKDVLGNVLQAANGKQPPRLPKGRNTEIVNNSTELISSIDGQIIYLNGSVSISEVVEVIGDVNNATGNINFNGTVRVRGNVLSGFRVVAIGNVEVEGFIEGAEVINQGNIMVKKEIIGMNKAHIESSGNLSCMLVKNATLAVSGDIFSDGIMHCDLKCDGRIELKGIKGVIVGGSALVKKELDAFVIGSPMATSTDIKVGLDAEVFMRYKANVDSLNELKKQYEELSLTINSMSKIKDINSLPMVKKQTYIKTIYDAQFLREKIEKLQQETFVIKAELDKFKHSGRVYARNVIYSGVNLQIGNAVLSVRDPIYSSMIVNDKGRIRVVALS